MNMIARGWWLHDDIDAVDVFSRVVSAAGCRFTAEGTNVTIVADLDEADLSVPRVADLERQLAAEGFASVADGPRVGGDCS